MADRSKTPDLFTPLFECVVEKYGIIGAGVFGEVWRYCQMDRHQCDAAAQTIADTLHVSLRTVQRWFKVLVGNDAEWNRLHLDHEPYIRDLTPGRRNKPHVYVATSTVWRDAESKNAMPESHTRTTEPAPTVTESHSAMSESHRAMTESHHDYDRESYEETYKRPPNETSKETTAAPPPVPQELTPGPEPTKQAPTLTQQEVDAYLDEPDPELTNHWATVRLDLQGQAPRQMFDQWYAPLKPLVLRDGYVFLAHPTAHGQQWCTTRLKTAIDRTLRAIIPGSMECRIVVGGGP